ncbi:archease [Candidatus Woesearchaeota archaeon]|nr:archease [Candidatus Woesearchaeota archaeon]
MDDAPGRWKFFPHTADAKFTAYGQTMEECFTNAGIACFEIITETKKVKSVKRHTISVKAKRPTALLFDFLDELLFLLDTEGLLVCDIQDMAICEEEDTWLLTAKVFGDYHKGYDVSCNVKAVTYNDMELKETDKGWECTVVVDL